MSCSKYKRADLKKVRTVPFDSIRRKMTAAEVVKAANQVDTVEELLEIIPDIGSGKDFKHLAKTLAHASRTQNTSILLMGAHVIKCGLGGLIAELAERGVFTSISMSGAGAIHDLELAYWGETSESVDDTLPDGTFGMSRETADKFVESAALAEQEKLGFGEAMGKLINEQSAPYRQSSLLARCFEISVPVTIHIAIGADTVNMHPTFNAGQAAGASYRDLEILTGSVSRLCEGSVVVNLGSAVVLPEVFLKCLSAARNLGFEATGFLAANLDMIQHYRAVQNVVVRPTESDLQRVLITGRHELTVPLLTAAIFHELRS